MYLRKKGPGGPFRSNQIGYFLASSAGAGAGAAAVSATTGAGAAGAGASFLPQATNIAATSRIDSAFILESYTEAKANSIFFDVFTAGADAKASTNGFG